MNNKKFFCGYFEADITPEAPVALDGFAARSGKSVGVRDPLYLKVIALEDSFGEACLMLVFDMIGFDLPLAARIKTAACNASSLAPSRVMILSTHTHSGPAAGVLYGLEKDETYWDHVISLVDTAVKNAVSTKRAVSLSLEEHPIKIGINRREIKDGKVVLGRNPDKMCDDGLRIVRFFSNDETIGVLCNASCHPVNLGAPNMRITADYPSRIHAYAKEKENFFAVFTNSACGNINPLRPHDDDGEANLIACGDGIVNKLKDALLNKPEKIVENVKLLCLSDVAKLPLEFKYDAETMKEKLAYWREHEETDEDVNARYRAKVYANWYEIQLLEYEKETNPEMEIPIQLFSFGEFAILALPFELFAETRDRLCRIYETITGGKLVVCGYADAVRSYLPDPEALSEGGYETESACVWYAVPGKYTPKSEPALISACEKLFSHLTKE